MPKEYGQMFNRHQDPSGSLHGTTNSYLESLSERTLGFKPSEQLDPSIEEGKGSSRIPQLQSRSKATTRRAKLFLSCSNSSYYRGNLTKYKNEHSPCGPSSPDLFLHRYHWAKGPTLALDRVQP
ncbi:hypothetical protein RND71_026302 [Anisodus tanguticus]|uniref:Uncharacterized protein n=1 Tax=Anisodus tanguticus TaxID=243964 RepID=A0AAE1RNM9_9SOLA|nr:hypothetical protein RND71_026302 [Anisodus tanguticus]